MTLSQPAGRRDQATRLIDALPHEGPALIIVLGHRGAGKTTLLSYLEDVARSQRPHPVIRESG